MHPLHFCLASTARRLPSHILVRLSYVEAECVTGVEGSAYLKYEGESLGNQLCLPAFSGPPILK